MHSLNGNGATGRYYCWGKIFAKALTIGTGNVETEKYV
jgi:hypothetical protein